jgi:hypothetical protein
MKRRRSQRRSRRHLYPSRPKCSSYISGRNPLYRRRLFWRVRVEAREPLELLAAAAACEQRALAE